MSPKKAAGDTIELSLARDEASDRQDQRNQGKTKAKGR
jgi:hypothetical protein